MGQFDLQLYFGDSWFAAQSAVELTKDSVSVGSWEPGRWPASTFYDVMNAAIIRAYVKDERTLLIELENGLCIHFKDDTDQFESVQIRIAGQDLVVV